MSTTNKCSKCGSDLQEGFIVDKSENSAWTNRMRLTSVIIAILLCFCGCANKAPTSEHRKSAPKVASSVPRVPAPTDNNTMKPLDEVLGALLETWDNRYTFKLDREKQVLRLSVLNFELLATEGSDGQILLSFEEAGTKHRVECTTKEAPKVIEALLFPNK